MNARKRMDDSAFVGPSGTKRTLGERDPQQPTEVVRTKRETPRPGSNGRCGRRERARRRRARLGREYLRLMSESCCR